MAGFAVYFFLCNLFISCIIGILFAVKKACSGRLSSRVQYHLGFLLFAFLALPFIPFRILDIASFFQPGMYAGYGGSAADGAAGHLFIDTSMQVNDFAVSVSRRAPSVLGWLVCLLWFAGMGVMLFFTIRSCLHLRKLICSALPLQNGEVKRLYQECLKEAGIHRQLPVYSTAFLKSPVILGLLKPRIYLPIHIISDYDAVSMRLMLLHELQHYRHRDIAVTYLMHLAGIVYWFNPFVWYALQEMGCEREIACDSSVLQMLQETEYQRYGNALIDLAEKISREDFFFSFLPFAAGHGGNRRQIRRRVLHIASYRKESKCTKIQSCFAGVIIMASFLAFSPVLPAYAGGGDKYDFSEKNKNVACIDVSMEFGGYQGSFVLYDSYQDAWLIYNKEAALERIAPDSTYKIYDALLGLEAGIITPAHSEIAWDGKEYPFAAWESDQDLSSAMRSSVNWYFQEIDRRAGMGSIKAYLQEIGYGNQQAGSSTDLYWADFSLKISPVEQVELLQKFYHNAFGFSGHNINAVKDAIFISDTPKGTLSGKTGTGGVEGQDTSGWFIGYIEKSGHVYYFATNMQGASGATGSVAMETSLAILSGMGLWENG